MNTKICVICGKEKTVEDFRTFYDKKKNKNYKLKKCKECENKLNKEYAIKNENKIADYKKNYYLKNKETINNKRKQNEEHYKEWRKEYRLNHEKQIKEYMQEYRNKNSEKIRKAANDYNIRKRKEDNLFKIKHQTRNMILSSFKRKNKKKEKETKYIIGCDFDFFAEYLKDTFKNNYGYEWDGKETVHIDHIIPLATAKTEEEIYKLCHYTNLQLLKAKDNLSKKAKLNWEIGK